jgi:cytidylate kinase
MTKSSTPLNSDLVAAAKLRFEHWLLSPELTEFMRAHRDVKKPATTGPFIAISREAASGGAKVAQIVAEQLGWDVLDKELLEVIATRYKLPRDMLELVDETKADWFHDVLGTFIDSQLVSHDAFVHHLTRIVYLAALHGNVVFVGRGAYAVLPRKNGLAVRIVAPKSQRVEEMMRRCGLSRHAATLRVDEMDKQRRQFCRHHFHHDTNDPLEYDLVINTARFSQEVAAGLIVEAFCRAQRGESHHASKGK